MHSSVHFMYNFFTLFITGYQTFNCLVNKPRHITPGLNWSCIAYAMLKLPLDTVFYSKVYINLTISPLVAHTAIINN